RAGLRRVLDVLRDELNRLAVLVEHDDLRDADRIVHCAAEDPRFTDALIDGGLEEERLVELVGREFEEDLVVLLPDFEESRRLLCILDDFREWPRVRGRRSAGTRSAGGIGVRRRARRLVTQRRRRDGRQFTGSRAVATRQARATG